MSEYQSDEYTFRFDFPALAAEARRLRQLGQVVPPGICQCPCHDNDWTDEDPCPECDPPGESTATIPLRH